MNLLLLAAAALLTSPSPISSQDQVTMEGSSTIAPYARAMTRLLRHPEMLTVVQNGSGTGIARLCSGRPLSPQIAASSRPIKPREIERCAANGIETLVEKPIGRDGIVLAQSVKAKDLELTVRDLYLATANYIPRAEDDCVLVKNIKVKWKDVRSDLPDREIIVIGPPRSSGTRDVFLEKAVAVGARSFHCLAAIEHSSPDYFAKATKIRLDSHWVDGGEQDEAVAQTLRYVRDAIGIFGYAYLVEVKDIEAIPLDGVEPTVETIASGEYELSRGLYLYADKRSFEGDHPVAEIYRAFGSFGAIGPGGFLTEMGLVTTGHASPEMEIDTRKGRPAPKKAPASGHGDGHHGDEHQAAASHGNGHHETPPLPAARLNSGGHGESAKVMAASHHEQASHHEEEAQHETTSHEEAAEHHEEAGHHETESHHSPSGH
ncbi:PstS family phosphate ABC transporter substrate-binding protein [Parvularcula marina]|uniref:PstS family phosphate ABC transporter substrate-binding protein n=1 Tax=Parvularcula marina TaxID=2292771 RepID=UPI003512F8E9